MKMFRGVPIRRIVAASDVAADLAQPKVNPTSADLQTIFAAICARGNGTYLAQVFAALHIGNEFILALHRTLSNVVTKRDKSLVGITP